MCMADEVKTTMEKNASLSAGKDYKVILSGLNQAKNHPSAFYSNEQTSYTNHYQEDATNEDIEEITQKALVEFHNLKDKIEAKGISKSTPGTLITWVGSLTPVSDTFFVNNLVFLRFILVLDGLERSGRLVGTIST